MLHIKGIPIPYGAPNAAAHIERFMGSLKRECLNHFIFLSEDHLRRTVSERATLAAMLAGFGMTVAISLFPDLPGDFAERIVPFVAAGTIAWIGSRT